MAEKRRFKAHREFKRGLDDEEEEEGKYHFGNRRSEGGGFGNRRGEGRHFEGGSRSRNFSEGRGERRNEWNGRRDDRGDKRSFGERKPFREGFGKPFDRSTKPYNRNRKNNRYDEEN